MRAALRGPRGPRRQTWGPELGAWREAARGAGVLYLPGQSRERELSFRPALSQGGPHTCPVFLKGCLESFSTRIPFETPGEMQGGLLFLQIL